MPVHRIYGCDSGDGFALADTGEIMDKKDRKEFDIETMKDEFLAVKTLKTIFNSLSMLMLTYKMRFLCNPQC